MKALWDKLRIIYLPFVLVVIGFLLGYTFLHWLLFIKMGMSLKEDLLKLWFPMALPWLPILVWLRPRINLLRFKNENGAFIFQFLAWLIIAGPTIMAQEYLITVTGKLTSLDHISQISKMGKTKYYALKHYYIDRGHFMFRATAEVSGKHDEHLDLKIYVVMPVLDRAGDTLLPLNKTNLYWLGKKYEQRISNKLSDQQKDDTFRKFAANTQIVFKQTDFNIFTYLERIGNVDDHDEYNKLLKSNEWPVEGAVILKADVQPFSARNGDALSWVFTWLGIGLAAWLVFLLFPPFREDKVTQFTSGTIADKNDLKEVFVFFVPVKDFFITPILIDLNILIYLLMVISGLGFISFKAEDVLGWGANFRPLTTDGQWWCLLTNTFLHGGAMHLLANMYGLLFVGIFLEPVLGRKKYLIVYLLTGILASVASIWWHDATVSIGASGAIFGLYGVFLACLLLRVFPASIGKPLLISTLVFVGFNLVTGVLGGIDNAAHIGGLLSGFIIGLFLARTLEPVPE